MKILVISHMYPSVFDEIDGIFVHEQVKELIKQKCEVRVISPISWTPFPIKHLKSKWQDYSKIPEKMNWNGVKVYYPRYLEFPKGLFFASSGHLMYYGIREIVDEIRQEFSFGLIHAHVALPDGYAAILINHKFGKPLVVTIHGQDLQQTIFRNTKCFKAVRKVFISADRVVVVSNKLKRIAEDHFNKSENLTVIHNGVSATNLFMGNSLLIQGYESKRLILSVSSLIKTKGIDFNLRVIRQLINKYSDLHYMVIGDGPEGRRLEKLSLDLGIREHVDFLGQQPHDKVMEYMSMCDIFSLPSWNEGFGVVYLEAMFSGKPVIACKDQGIMDVVKDGETGLLVKSKDVDSLVKAIDFLLSHLGEAKKIGERARKLVLDNYTWEKNAEKTIRIYKEVLGVR